MKTYSISASLLRVWEVRLGIYTTMAGGDLIAKVGVGRGTNFSAMGPGTAILVVACDLQEEAPIWWLRVKQAADRGASVMVLNPRPTKLDNHATYLYRYAYGTEAATVLAMINALSAKRPDLGEAAPSARDLSDIARAFADAENAVIIYGSEGLGLEGSQALAQACANLLIATNHIGRANNGLIAAWQDGNTQAPGIWVCVQCPICAWLSNLPARYMWLPLILWLTIQF